jgi:hypothetical protein
LEKSPEITSIKSFVLKIDEDSLLVDLDYTRSITKITFNDIDFTDVFARESLYFSSSDFVPYPFVVPTQPSATSISNLENGMGFVYSRLAKAYRGYLHGNVSDRSVNRIIRSVRYAPREPFIRQMQSIDPELHSWQVLVAHLRKGEQRHDLDQIRALHFFADFQEYALELEGIFRTLFQNITYIGPARATGERYYRWQELAVDQIDPLGENFAMFLSSLSPSLIENFANWVVNYIGYRIKIERLAGHVSVFVQEANSPHEYNLADMGYGFSQILPILAQVWIQRYLRRGSGSEWPIVALEQPELHLHPALQASLADAFVSVIYKLAGANSWEGTGLHLLVETHSDALISRLGELVSAGELSPDDVAIYVFDRGSDEDCTDVTQSYFDSDGRLKNWPFGFFSRKLKS